MKGKKTQCGIYRETNKLNCMSSEYDPQYKGGKRRFSGRSYLSNFGT